MIVPWSKYDKVWSPTGHKTRQNYWLHREASGDYADYWGCVQDPDGRWRDRLSDDERLSYLENVAEELTFVQSLPAGCILDYGCGPGWFLEQLQPDWDILGLEISRSAIKRLMSCGIPYVQCTHNLPPDTFDVIVCLHVIEHLPNPLIAIHQCHRAIRSGGWLILGTPDFDSPCAQRFGDNYRMLHDPTHCSLFTRESCHRMLREHGFDIVDVRYPFPDRYATRETFARWHDTSKVSPPWPGNWMTFYCRRSGG